MRPSSNYEREDTEVKLTTSMSRIRSSQSRNVRPTPDMQSLRWARYPPASPKVQRIVNSSSSLSLLPSVVQSDVTTKSSAMDRMWAVISLGRSNTSNQCKETKNAHPTHNKEPPMECPTKDNLRREKSTPTPVPSPAKNAWMPRE